MRKITGWLSTGNTELKRHVLKNGLKIIARKGIVKIHCKKGFHQLLEDADAWAFSKTKF